MICRIAILWVVFAWHTLASGLYPIEIQGATYPLLANQAQIQGIVKLKLHIEKTGLVSGVEIISGHPILAKAARNNIMLWKFAPLCSDQASRGSAIVFTYVFRLQGEVDVKPQTIFRYEHPYKVTLISEPLHWMPDKEDVGHK